MNARGGAQAPLLHSARQDNPGGIGDHELMAAVAYGDKTAFAELSERYLKTMLAVAQRILGNAAEADEVGQEAFLRLWQYAPRWDPNGTGSVRTWLSRVVTNLCFDRTRRRRSVPLDEADEIEDPGQGPYDRLKHDDRRQLVQDLLQALPERQRTAVVLSYFEGQSGQNVAEVMGLSVGAVESLLVRARRGLRNELNKRGLVWGEDV